MPHPFIKAETFYHHNHVPQLPNSSCVLCGQIESNPIHEPFTAEGKLRRTNEALQQIQAILNSAGISPVEEAEVS